MHESISAFCVTKQQRGMTSWARDGTSTIDLRRQRLLNSSFTHVLLLIAIIVAAAMIARWIAERVGQPSVLSELMLGIVIGNVGYWLGNPLFVLIMHSDDVGAQLHEAWIQPPVAITPDQSSRLENETPDVLAEVMSRPNAPEFALAVFTFGFLAHLGVLLLLFSAGLESDIGRMRRQWRTAFCVAIVGIVAPFVLGFVACLILHAKMSILGHLFLAAALAATSIGITARVFEDLNALHSREAEVILSAAIIDDVFGLILLSVVVGMASAGTVNASEIGEIVLVATFFLGVVFLVGEHFARWGTSVALEIDRHHGKLLFPLLLMLSMAWFAESIHLAAIVGAFGAGVIIKEQHFPSEQVTPTLAQQIAPLERFLAPVFFLFVGMQINIANFIDLTTFSMALLFTVAAIIGKLAAGLVAGKAVDRLTVGVGMVPRGEVGLIFVSIGRGLGFVNDSLFSSLVVVMIVTTLFTPPAMKMSLRRLGRLTSANSDLKDR